MGDPRAVVTTRPGLVDTLVTTRPGLVDTGDNETRTGRYETRTGRYAEALELD